MNLITVCPSIQLEKYVITKNISWVTQLLPTDNKIKKRFQNQFVNRVLTTRENDSKNFTGWQFHNGRYKLIYSVIEIRKMNL